MGSPLAPVLANIFIGFHDESKWRNEYSLIKPKFYLMIICTENPLPVGGFLAYYHR